MKVKSFDDIVEYLTECFGREPTDSEVLMYINELESRHYDNLEAELKGN